MAILLAKDETAGRVLEEFIADRSFKEELGKKKDYPFPDNSGA